MKQYDSVIVGPVSLDINIDCEGHERRELGGAVVQAGFAAAGCGFRPLVLTKADPKTADPGERFRDSGVERRTEFRDSGIELLNRLFSSIAYC